MPQVLIKFFVAFVCCLSIAPITVAQEGYYRGQAYPFIREDLNEITNQNKGLKQFYRQLQKLESGKTKRINIVHIGDSHIQADWFSGMLRMNLQKRFGSAGRGLIFPYAVAKTNGPYDLYSSSNTRWESRRNSRSYPQSLKTGISGMGLRTENPNFQLKVRLEENPYELDYSFNRITFFAEQGPINFDWQVSPYAFSKQKPYAKQRENGEEKKPEFHIIESGDNLTRVAKRYGLTVEELKNLNGLESSTIYAGQKLIVSRSGAASSWQYNNNYKDADPFMLNRFFVPISDRSMMGNFHSIAWEDPSKEFYLRATKNTRLQSQSILYGMVLENTEEAGVLYHMIGVNGAEFKHFNQSGIFWKQVKALNPDLIIISLGTNESVHRYFNPNNFFEQIDEFINDLEKNIPFTDILFTTPPEALRSGSTENPTVRRCKNIILSYSLANELACWDFFEIMGGSGSIHQWKDAYLAQQDYLHLTRAGYELQGKLLYRALMKGYGDFRMAESK
ncbi:MAG: LysM peptidoglycan-binding domain-containing protein [Bacteroidota bacterium]